jgi:hypothetical protein
MIVLLGLLLVGLLLNGAAIVPLAFKGLLVEVVIDFFHSLDQVVSGVGFRLL